MLQDSLGSGEQGSLVELGPRGLVGLEAVSMQLVWVGGGRLPFRPPVH